VYTCNGRQTGRQAGRQAGGVVQLFGWSGAARWFMVSLILGQGFI
jgi:hypothetical protein